MQSPVLKPVMVKILAEAGGFMVIGLVLGAPYGNPALGMVLGLVFGLLFQGALAWVRSRYYGSR
ncbi:MAG TPA: hypothetical protein VKB50_16265 [Vicinamibacterales bacterium]|nr:hypothetical protein [Vicinamibacterales bacterium]